MELNLPTAIESVVQPLFDALPLDQAMEQLVVSRGGPADLVQSIVEDPALNAFPGLQAGLWLYVDQLDRSHDISQSMKNQTGSFWHGIMHRREGDFGNSHYWFRQTGHHPAMDDIEGYDGHAFIDDVEAACRGRRDTTALIDMQRLEWARLFEWCATNA